MKNISSMLLVAALALTPLSIALADDAQTLSGEFNWSAGPTGDLEAVFTPTGDGKWDVSFYFEFRGENHVYTGEAVGDLGGGKLSGTVLNDNKKRTFTFEGTTKDGKFKGTHAEITGGGNQKTGTLTLGR